LIARAVAPGGIVYGQNPADLGEKPKSLTHKGWQDFMPAPASL
jgi:hypothetical protein